MVKGKRIFFKEDGILKEIIPRERVDDFLRDQIYSKDSNLPFSRDGAHYKLLKTTIGCSRRNLMSFLRSQKSLAETRPSLPKVKRHAMRKLKKLQLETDLIFVRRPDVIKANPKFHNDELKMETYIITTVEKASGLVKLDYLQKKSDTNSALERHIRWFSKRFKIPPSQFSLRSDKGDEYSMPRIKKLIPDYAYVPTAASCERKNRQVEQNLFRILKNRMSLTLKDAVKKAEKICNETVSKIHRRTPNEVSEQKQDDIIKKFNSTRTTFQKGDNRKDFEVGQYVRRLAPDKKRRGLKYKSYKGLAYIDEPAKKITHVTKRAVPKKYRVAGKWYLQSTLLLAGKDDAKSKQLIRDRDIEQAEENKKLEQQHLAEVKKKDEEFARQKKEDDAKKSKGDETGHRRSRRSKSGFVKKLQEQRAKEERQARIIEEADERWYQSTHSFLIIYVY